MKLPPFDYTVPRSVDEGVALLRGAAPYAAVLAGGQSLLLEMRYGDASPGLLVDVNRIPGLDRLAVSEGALHVGATVRHSALEHLPDEVGAGPLGRLLRAVGPQVAHPPIRARGTFVGSLAWGHPNAEWCALAALTDAVVRLHGAAGERTVTASDWFTGHRRTARRPDELATEVSLPLLPADAGVGFVEHRRTHASFALVAALAAVTVDDDRVGAVRITVAGAGAVPLRARTAEAQLAGSTPTHEALAAAGAAAAEASDPVFEPHASSPYRRHAIAVVVRRALEQAVADAARQQERQAVA